ncbi:MAG TPA: hypothetical protein VL992_16250 [Tepidisphaeraceae bacterium]|nr:hypothetical protein [Tepidisphaeraceae bacterium]
MISLVEQNRAAIEAACRRHGVRRLELFGSASDEATFDAARSDVDFLVSFAPGADLGPWLAVYFDLRDDLERTLDRPVELVMETAMRSPLFRREADRTRQVIYAAQDSEAA